MKIDIQHIAAANGANAMIYHLIRLYAATFRLQVENEKPWLRYFVKEKGRVLLCAYHQQFFSAIRYFKTYKKFRPGLMISRSRDGEIIAGVAARTGWVPVRGSSSRGSRKALAAMIHHLKTHRIAGHVVDGPQGPAFTVKPGTIRLAQAANAVIVPFYTIAQTAFHFKSWDRFFIPRPFSTVVLRYGAIRTINTDLSPEAFENERKNLEQQMASEFSALKRRFPLPPP